METQAQEQTVEQTGSKLSQKDAVYTFVTEALAGLAPGEGQKLKDLVTKEVRKTVRQKLFAAVKSGEVKLSKQFDDSKLKKYCSGLINNWLKKDTRFN
jgi:poly-gamma-glutamate capsule biosynthesis protein CapA/YwtB (metallophosphatase superfamily)